MGSHFGVGEFTTHFMTYFSGDWDVHWEHGLLTVLKEKAENISRSPDLENHPCTVQKNIPT